MTRRILAFADSLQIEAPELRWILYGIWKGLSWDRARLAVQYGIDSGRLVVVRTEVLA